MSSASPHNAEGVVVGVGGKEMAATAAQTGSPGGGEGQVFLQEGGGVTW